LIMITAVMSLSSPNISRAKPSARRAAQVCQYHGQRAAYFRNAGRVCTVGSLHDLQRLPQEQFCLSVAPLPLRDSALQQSYPCIVQRTGTEALQVAIIGMKEMLGAGGIAAFGNFADEGAQSRKDIFSLGIGLLLPDPHCGHEVRARLVALTPIALDGAQ